ncbi:hypothetical protein GO308_08465 [Sphingomonas sp. SFZ2018-12]|uniref:EI24 domain-containing protein n=1 Tax=Sphingomonas sp. SFZ2018-12 TaxID=2683197 RepID=UPI001F0E325F|nr:EI24 domain-containing protein [Sphingomonas sp. SFZ2018-12]MCH4893139.1 hypothetical protein [Sphingomonas sp. SFZ2018-12]
MLNALILSLRQLDDRPVWSVMLKSFAVTVALFAALGPLCWWLARRAAGWAGGTGWWQELAGAVAVLAVVLGAWLLFRAVAVAVIGMFGDQIVRAVEARHYPDRLASARDVAFLPSLRMAIASAARAIGFNLLLAPVYLILLFTAIGPAIAFFAVNSWLLGRDLGDMIAARHLPLDALPDWRARTRGERLVLGAIGTALFLVPILNLAAPILGAAMATHLFHRRKS